MIIDISNEIYTEIKNDLVAIDFNTYKNSPKKTPEFPCVTVGFNNLTHLGSIDSSGEQHNDQFIDINMYSQSENSIEEINLARMRIDAILADKYKMTRIVDNEIENQADRTIDRWIMRYSYVISKTKTIYRG